MNPGYATLGPMSTTGTSSPASAQHLVPRANTGHEPRLDEERLRDGRIVHRDDAADDDEVARPGFRGAGGVVGAGEPPEGQTPISESSASEGAAGDEGEPDQCRQR